MAPPSLSAASERNARDLSAMMEKAVGQVTALADQVPEAPEGKNQLVAMAASINNKMGQLFKELNQPDNVPEGDVTMADLAKLHEEKCHDVEVEVKKKFANLQKGI